MTVKVTRPGQGEQIARHEDALTMLGAALAAPPKSKLRQTYLEGALMAYYFGLLNQHHFGKRGDRRGAPKGKRGARHDDDAALAEMRKISEILGETRPHTLARFAVNMGCVDLRNAQPATVVRRLAGRWRTCRSN